MRLRGHLKNISVKVPNIPNETEKNVNIHFHHYKYMENISCHSNQSFYRTGIKAIYVEANVLSMHAKFQLIPPYGF